MIIRSQDKHRLETMDRAYVSICGDIVYINGIDFGRYSTEEKAIKVLDMICDAYCRMEDIKCGAVQAQKNDSFCFNMPQDCEV